MGLENGSESGVAFVLNPHAGGGRAGRLWPRLEPAIAERFQKWTVCKTERGGDAIRLAKEAVEARWGTVVSVGGDGTHNEVINGYLAAGGGAKAAFGLVPIGTGGDFRRTIGLPNDPFAAIDVIRVGKTRMLDAGWMSFVDNDGKPAERHFLNIASFGIGGEVDAAVNRTTKSLGGRISFLLGSLRAILTYSNRKVKFRKVGDPTWTEMPVFLVAVANGQYFGGGMHAAPQASIDDGLFDVLVMGDLTTVETLRNSSKIYSARHLNHPKVSVFRATEIEAESDEIVLLDVDGEQPGRLPARFRLLPGAIRLIVPG